jgi:urocanate hydratase
MDASRHSIARHVTAMLAFQKAGAIVFDNGNLIRTQAKHAGVANAFDIPIFTEAFLRPLFARAIGPFRWIALSNDPQDIRKIDDLLLARFRNNHIVGNWVKLAREHLPFRAFRRALPGSATANAASSASRSIAWCARSCCQDPSLSPATISTRARWRTPTS